MVFAARLSGFSIGGKDGKKTRMAGDRRTTRKANNINIDSSYLEETLHKPPEARQLVHGQPDVRLTGIVDVPALVALLEVRDLAQLRNLLVVKDELGDLFLAEAGVAAVVGAAGRVRSEHLGLGGEGEEALALSVGCISAYA